MRRSVLIVVVFISLIPVTGLGQDARPSAAFAPLAVIGDISAAQKEIIHTSLEALLSNDYHLISQQEYRKAEEFAFEQLDFDQCTEDQCVRLIQEVLQVNELYILQIVSDADFSQLSLTLFRQDERIVRAETCEGCSTAQLNAKVGVLYTGIQGDAPIPPSPVMGTLALSDWTPEHRITIDGLSANPGSDGRLELEPGEHRIEIWRQGYTAKPSSVLIAAGQTTSLGAELDPIAGRLSISGVPARAKVDIRGGRYVKRRVNKTLPVTELALPVGQYTVVAKAPGHRNRNSTVIIEEGKMATLEINLDELPARLTIEVSPPDSVIVIDGKTVGTGPRVTTEISSGTHRIRVAHPSGNYEASDREVKFSPGSGGRESFDLMPTSAFLARQAYESDLTSWRGKWGSTLAGAVLAGVYMVVENQNVQDANSKSNQAIENMVASSSAQEAEPYRVEAKKQAESADEHERNAAIGQFVAVALFGLAAWIYFDEPLRPDRTAWQLYVADENIVGLAYHRRW